MLAGHGGPRGAEADIEASPQGRTQERFPGRDRYSCRRELRAGEVLRVGFNRDRTRRGGGLNDELRQAIEETAQRLFVGFLTVGIAVMSGSGSVYWPVSNAAWSCRSQRHCAPWKGRAQSNSE